MKRTFAAIVASLLLTACSSLLPKKPAEPKLASSEYCGSVSSSYGASAMTATVAGVLATVGGTGAVVSGATKQPVPVQAAFGGPAVIAGLAAAIGGALA